MVWAGNLSYHLKSRPKWYLNLIKIRKAKKSKDLKKILNMCRFIYPAKIMEVNEKI